MRLSCFNPQFFIGSKVGDTALEAEYGAMARRSRREMQIVVDALRALSTALPREQLPRHDRLAIDRLEELAAEMDRAGQRDHEVEAFGTGEIDDLVRRLRQLRRDNPESADNVLRRLSEEAVPIPARPE